MTHLATPSAGLPRRRVDSARRAGLVGELEELFLREGFATLTVDDLCRRLRCSKTTLYTVAPTREQIVQAVTRHFFATSTLAIEAAVEAESDPRAKISVYLHGVGSAMSRNSAAFYQDMVEYAPTAEIYRLNSVAAARRVRELIDAGIAAGVFVPTDARFTAELVSLAIDGVHSGRLLESTGFTAGEAFAELGDLFLRSLTVSVSG